MDPDRLPAAPPSLLTAIAHIVLNHQPIRGVGIAIPDVGRMAAARLRPGF